MKEKKRQSLIKIIIISSIVIAVFVLGRFLIGFVMEEQSEVVKDISVQNKIGQLRSLGEMLYTFEDKYKGFYDASVGSSEMESNNKFREIREEIDEVSGGGFEIIFSVEEDYAHYCMYAPLLEEDAFFCVDSTGNAMTIYDHGENCDNYIRCEEEKTEE